MSKINPLELFFLRLDEKIRHKLRLYTDREKLADMERFLSDRNITTITAQELFDNLHGVPEAIASKYAKVMQEIIKDNLEEIESIIALEASIVTLSNLVATAAKQDAAQTVLDNIKTGVDLNATFARQDIAKGILDSILLGTDKIVADGATEAKQDLQATAANQGKGYYLSASDNIEISDNTQHAGAGTTWVKRYQFTILTIGVVRVTFDLKEFVAGRSAWAQIRVNGIDVGPQHSENGQVYVNQTQDVPIGSGDLLQIWTRDSAADGQPWSRNAKVRCDQALGAPAVGEVSI